MTRRFPLLAVLALSLGLFVGCEKSDDVTGGDDPPSTEDDGTREPDSLVLAPAFPQLLANGMDEVDIVALIVDDAGRGLGDVGVRFQTTVGAIEPFGTTNASGLVRVSLTSAVSAPDIVAIVTAEVVDAEGVSLRNVADDSDANIDSPVGRHRARLILASREPDDQAVAMSRISLRSDQVSVPMTGVSLSVTADPATIPADGASASRITASLVETTRRVPIGGEEIRFGVTSGSITGRAVTDATGAAVAFLTGAASGADVIVTAFYGGISRTVSVEFSPPSDRLSLSGDVTTVLADGLVSTLLTAQLLDGFGQPAGAGTQIDFTTTRGVLEDATPTDASGRAVVRLRAARNETGLARVTARSGGDVATLDVQFVSEAAAHIIPAHVDRRHIGVRGAGDVETSSIRYVVLDDSGIPVDLSHAVTVSFTIVPVSGGSDAVVSPAQGRTNERGEVVATVNSGLLSGTLELRAAVGALATEPIRIVVHGGLPDPNHFSISFERLNIAGLVYDGLRDPVTARVADRHGNPVPDSTAVWFTSDFGIVQGSAQTNPHGEAAVDHITAGPRPAIPSGVGLVRICAQTVSLEDPSIDVCGSVLWSGPTIVEVTSPKSFDIPNGGAVTIQFRVRDANENPLTGGTSITVTSSAGDVEGDVNLVLPDTQSDQYTFFRCTLSDDAPEEDVARSVTVNIAVVSQNGNRSASLTGTMH